MCVCVMLKMVTSRDLKQGRVVGSSHNNLNCHVLSTLLLRVSLPRLLFCRDMVKPCQIMLAAWCSMLLFNRLSGGVNINKQGPPPRRRTRNLVACELLSCWSQLSCFVLASNPVPGTPRPPGARDHGGHDQSRPCLPPLPDHSRAPLIPSLCMHAHTLACMYAHAVGVRTQHSCPLHQGQ